MNDTPAVSPVEDPDPATAGRRVEPSPSDERPHAHDDAVPPWSLKPRKLGLRRVFSVGAGAILAAFFIGTGDIVIATQMGARFGYALWWSYFVLALAGWALIDMSVRYYLRFGKTPMSLFKDIHPHLAILLFVLVVVCAIIGSASQWNACAMVLTGFYPEVPLEASGAVAAVLAVVVIFQGFFDRLEKLFAAALVALIACFFASAILARADWSEALGGLVPRLPTGLDGAARSAWSNLLVANAGSMINAWLILLYPYTMMEKGWFSDRLQEKTNLLHRVRIDYAWAMLAAALVALPIMAASASVARQLGVVPQNYNEFAVLLDPLARQVAGKDVGKFAAKLFLAGLFIAAWTSGVAWWMGGAYALLDIFRLPIRMNSRPMRILVVLFFIPSVAILFLRINPAVQIVIFAVFLAVVFPVVGIAVVWRVSRRDMGYFRWAKPAAILIALDLFALAVSILAGWGELSRVLKN